MTKNNFSTYKNALIISSQPLDPDCIASGTLLKKYLQSLGVEVTHCFSREISDKERLNFNHLPFFEEFEGKDTREYFEKEMFDVLILVDGSEETQFFDRKNTKLPPPDFSIYKNRIVVDHHPSNDGHLGTINITNPKASSATEVALTEIIPIEFLDEDLALLAYAGIVGDTGNFQWNFTPKTLRLTAQLLEKGVDPVQITERYFRNKSVEFFDALSFAIEHTEYLEEIQTQVLFLSLNSILEHNLDEDRIKLIKYAFKSSLAAFVKGYPRGIQVFEYEPGRLTVSGRGSNIFNTISLPKLFERIGGTGGGHFNSAGMGIDMNVEEFRIKLFESIKELM